MQNGKYKMQNGEQHLWCFGVLGQVVILHFALCILDFAFSCF